jgi:hypothetical protein
VQAGCIEVLHENENLRVILWNFFSIGALQRHIMGVLIFFW